ncbi:MAG: folate-binding protein YgfZ [Alphaproteobacteria bacterium]|nr:folate-binding protein YgfZ [Alphaproteobacteria bacterium]
MAKPLICARLDDRAVLAISGPDWRDFLQGLLTQDVAQLTPGEIRFGALLTPQGRLLHDLFLVGRDEGCLLDVQAGQREAIAARLGLYRLRAKVDLALSDLKVAALWGEPGADAGLDGFSPDPRLPELGWRGYGAAPPSGAAIADAAAYRRHAMGLGIPGPADWGQDETYPIEANFDLLQGIDFKKGCFVGQETTSRMKRRGTVRSRMIPVRLQGAAPEAGAELLAGTLRAGELRSVEGELGLALVRLDRLEAGPLNHAGGAWEPIWPPWLEAARASEP